MRRARISPTQPIAYGHCGAAREYDGIRTAAPGELRWAHDSVVARGSYGASRMRSYEETSTSNEALRLSPGPGCQLETPLGSGIGRRALRRCTA
eukprot:scaffold299279_cov39-Tisochrysis_lutea.AAC.5